MTGGLKINLLPSADQLDQSNRIPDEDKDRIILEYKLFDVIPADQGDQLDKMRMLKADKDRIILAYKLLTVGMPIFPKKVYILITGIP